jgi:NADH-quinone oxidoreductase subunit L
VENLIGLLVAAPLLGAALLLCGGRRLDRTGHYLGTALAGASFVIGAVLFADMLGRGEHDRALHSQVFSWIPVGGFRADVAFQLDQLSMTFVLLITGVGSLIHIYSIGYMAHDERRRRFFGYSTSSSRRCCCWSSPTTTCCCTSAGRASASRRTC